MRRLGVSLAGDQLQSHAPARPITSAATKSTGHGLAGNHALLAGRRSSAGGAARPEVVLSLQRTVGNRAVSRLLTDRPPTTVQRLSVTSNRLSPLLKKKPEQASFAAISKQLSAYEAAGSDLQKQVETLDKLDSACSDWLNGFHNFRRGIGQKAQTARTARLRLIRQLADELPAERAKLTKQQAQEIYLRNLRSKAGTPGALGALSTTAKMAKNAPKRIPQPVKDHGLSEAEMMAIIAFSATDYKYINPAMANSRSWLAGQKGNEEMTGLDRMLGDTSRKGKKKGSANPQATTFEGGAKQAVEEGALHGSMALAGLKKLPAFTDDTYRGERVTKAQFKQKYGVGKTFSFGAFGSSSWDEKVAASFAHGLGGDNVPKKQQSVAVVQVISASGGRDISEISLVPAEGEVLILPGSSFVVQTIELIDGPATYPDKVQDLVSGNHPLPKYWYKVTMAPVPNRSAST